MAEKETIVEEPIVLDKDNFTYYLDPKKRILLNCFAISSSVRLPNPAEAAAGRHSLLMDFLFIQGNTWIGSFCAVANNKIRLNQKFSVKILLTPVSEKEYMKRQNIELIQVKGTDGLGRV